MFAFSQTPHGMVLRCSRCHHFIHAAPVSCRCARLQQWNPVFLLHCRHDEIVEHSGSGVKDIRKALQGPAHAGGLAAYTDPLHASGLQCVILWQGYPVRVRRVLHVKFAHQSVYASVTDGVLLPANCCCAGAAAEVPAAGGGDWRGAAGTAVQKTAVLRA